MYIYLSLASLFNIAEMIDCAFSVNLSKYLPHAKFQPEKGWFGSRNVVLESWN